MAEMLRTVWYLFHLTVSTAIIGTAAVVGGIVGAHPRFFDACARNWSKINLWAAGTKVSMVGEENVPDGPVVFVSNHQSWFDIFALAAHLPGRVRFVAKKELMKVPILGRAMRAAQHIYIDRQNRLAAFSAYEQAAATIKRGVSAVVFAEGTRSRTGELQPFKKGPFVLAIAAQVPVVPVYCAGTYTLLPKGTIRLRSHPIAVLIGEPIPTEGLEYDDREALMDQSHQAVRQLRVDSAQVLR